MTCIVGLVNKGTIWMGGDSAGLSGWELSIRTDEKVFQNGPFLMGFTTSFRMGQLLRWAFKPPKQEGGEDGKFMVTTFIDAVRDCLKVGGFATKDKDVEGGGTFLVGYKGQLYYVGEDYQIGVNVDGFDAVGCGSEIAKGSMFTSAQLRRISPEQRILWALSAAERLNGGVRGPFAIRQLAN